MTTHCKIDNFNIFNMCEARPLYSSFKFLQFERIKKGVRRGKIPLQTPHPPPLALCSEVLREKGAEGKEGKEGKRGEEREGERLEKIIHSLYLDVLKII